MSIDRAIKNVAASFAMEGYVIDEKCKDWCRQLLHNELTMEEYIELVKKQTGIE